MLCPPLCLQHRRQACFPPSEKCATLLEELIAFENSTTGVTCRAFIEEFSDGSKPTAIAQAEVCNARRLDLWGLHIFSVAVMYSLELAKRIA